MKCIAVFIFLILPILVWTDVHAAASASRTDVVTAISVASAGDIVTIPSGSATWSSRIAVSVSITIQGAGVGSTVITDYGFDIADGVDDWRITGIEWTRSAVPADTECIQIGASFSTDGCRDWRIDNCKFTDYSRPMFMTGHNTGVIDNCTFYGMAPAGGDGIVIQGHNATAWTEPTSLGGGDFVFIEDCQFYSDGDVMGHVVTGGGGARYVFRYNTVTESGGAKISDAVDMHGAGHGETVSGCRVYEIYENTFVRTSASYARAIFVRGGTGVIHNNTFDETISSYTDGGGTRIELTEYRAAEYGGISATINLPCADTQYSADPGGEGYPACQQIGRGINSTSEPLYLWGNEDHNTNPITASVDANVNTPNTSEDYITLSTDYYEATKSYSTYTYPHPLRVGTRYFLFGGS